MRKTHELEHYKVGDVIKVLVFEIKHNNFNWRAIKYSEDKNPEFVDKDEIKEFTNDLLENKNDIFICDKINFGEMKLDTKKSIIVWIK